MFQRFDGRNGNKIVMNEIRISDHNDIYSYMRFNLSSQL